ANLFEQNRAHHIGSFADLEDELCTWVPGLPSPNRLDAEVWAYTELILGQDEALRTGANPLAGYRG
ncbi:hypothetical protein LCGC14_1985370, partial [marine sediment metagenome]